MNKSLDKLIFYLTNLSRKVLENSCETLIESRTNKISLEECETRANFYYDSYLFIKDIKRAVEDDKDEIEVFDDFLKLCPVLEISDFNDKDCYNIIIYLLKKNIRVSEKGSNEAIDIYKIQNYKFKSIDKLELDNLILSGRLKRLFNDPDIEMFESEKEFLREFYAKGDYFLHDFRPAIIKSRIALKHMKNVSCEEDIEITEKALKSFRVSDEIIEKIKRYLYKLLEKQERQEKQTKEETPKLKEVEEPKIIYLTEKDVKELKKYIRSFYNLYKMELTNIPTYEEFIKLIDSMEKLGTNSSEVKRFIEYVYDAICETDYISSLEELMIFISIMVKYKVREIDIYETIKKYKNTFINSIENPINKYLRLKEEIEFYDQELANSLKDIFESMFICGEEDYRTYKEIITEYIDEFVNNNDSIEYELTKYKVTK